LNSCFINAIEMPIVFDSIAKSDENKARSHKDETRIQREGVPFRS
jgi:hypothetical protein